MEMDMQEPGEMCGCCGEEHDLALTDRKRQKIAGLHAIESHIIISDRGITYSS